MKYLLIAYFTFSITFVTKVIKLDYGETK